MSLSVKMGRLLDYWGVRSDIIGILTSIEGKHENQSKRRDGAEVKD